ncbi:hypothetical protein [Actinokineospora cianjurensis]|nr:hypothetical protein [Actinokineospora cianjurensis]
MTVVLVELTSKTLLLGVAVGSGVAVAGLLGQRWRAEDLKNSEDGSD